MTEAISSVLAQTFHDFELIVVDNCSTDNTTQLVQSFAARDRRIRYVRNQINVGAQNNLNRCIELATGTYINILCADDLLEPTALEKLVRAFEDHPNISLASCARRIVDEALRPLNILSFSDRFECVSGIDVIHRCLKRGNLIGEPSAVLFRKLHAARGFDTRYRQFIDLEMWFYLLEKGNFAFVPEPLCKFRKHPGQGSLHNLSSFTVIEDEFFLYNEYHRKPYVHLSLFGRMMAKYRTVIRIWEIPVNGLPLDVLRTKMRAQYGQAFTALLLVLLRIKHAITRVLG